MPRICKAGPARSLGLCVAAGLLLASGPAVADDDETDLEGVSEEGEPVVGEHDPDGSDHRRHVGRVALGFLGTRYVPSAEPHPTEAVLISPEGNATVNIAQGEVVVPLFGLRYWINRTVGAELGIGFNVASGVETVTSPNPDPALSVTAERDAPSTTAFAARLGLPLSVYSASHYNLLLIAELDVGYSHSTISEFGLSTSGEPLDLSLSGFVFGVGGRFGAELSFGFIDVPQLSLQSAWGVRFESRRRKGQIGDAETVVTEAAFGSSWYGDPWDVLVGSFAVLYYF